MRKSDKKKNLQKVNLLAEQRYLKSKGIISEMFSGSEIDIDGITTSLVLTTLQGGDDATVYMRAKDSLVDSSDKVKGEFYNMLANKMEWSDLTNLAQQYRSIAKQYTLGLQEEQEQEEGDDFWTKYNTSVQEQKQICWNMIQHFKGFDAAIRENQMMLKNAIDKGYEDEAKILKFRLQYMENNRDMLDTPVNPFFKR